MGIGLDPCTPKGISLIPSIICAFLYSMLVLPKKVTSFDPDDDRSTAFGPQTLVEKYSSLASLEPRLGGRARGKLLG
jgi:hypothetical protein